jgi:hypothetical protein
MEYLVPHDKRGNVQHTGQVGINGRFFVSPMWFLADAGGYSFAAGILTDEHHGKWEAGSQGMALGREVGGNRIWVPDWKGGRIQLTDDTGDVIATLREGWKREPVFALTEPTKLWIRLSKEFDATQPYSAVIRFTNPVRETIVTTSQHQPWVNNRPTGRG